MASVAVELRAWLLSQTGVAALTTRIEPAPLGQSTALPAITYARIGGPPGAAHDGPSGLTRHLYQVDCWAETYAGADALGAAVIAALHAKQWGNLSMVIADRDMPVVDVGYFRRILDVHIWKKEF
jgi:hypothetical protein